MSIFLTALLLGIAYGLLATGIYISMRIFNIPDITTDGSFTLGAAVTAVLTTHLLSPLFILPAAFLAGAVAGMLTGLIHTRLKVNALLAGILVTTSLYSVNLAIMGRPNLPLIGKPTLFTAVALSADEPINQFVLLLLTGLLACLMLSYLLRTDFGLAMRATGNNETMIRAYGVNTDRMKITGLGLANGLTAVSGYLITGIQGYADINMGIGIVLLGLGAVMIGEMLARILSLKSISGKLAGVFLGSIVFRLLLGLALTAGIDPLYLKLLTSVFVLLTVGLPNLKKKA